MVNGPLIPRYVIFSKIFPLFALFGTALAWSVFHLPRGIGPCPILRRLQSVRFSPQHYSQPQPCLAVSSQMRKQARARRLITPRLYLPMQRLIKPNRGQRLIGVNHRLISSLTSQPQTKPKTLSFFLAETRKAALIRARL